MYGIWAMEIGANQGHNNRSEEDVEGPFDMFCCESLFP